MCSVSSVLTLRLKAKEHFRTTAILLFYILQKYNFNKSGVFFSDLLPCIISRAVVSLRRHKHARPPCRYYRLGSTILRWFRVAQLSYQMSSKSVQQFSSGNEQTLDGRTYKRDQPCIRSWLAHRAKNAQ
jgi:hypothetical protein